LSDGGRKSEAVSCFAEQADRLFPRVGEKFTTEVSEALRFSKGRKIFSHQKHENPQRFQGSEIADLVFQCLKNDEIIGLTPVPVTKEVTDRERQLGNLTLSVFCHFLKFTG